MGKQKGCHKGRSSFPFKGDRFSPSGRAKGDGAGWGGGAGRSVKIRVRTRELRLPFHYSSGLPAHREHSPAVVYARAAAYTHG